jgi:progressive ankylosis protein
MSFGSIVMLRRIIKGLQYMFVFLPANLNSLIIDRFPLEKNLKSAQSAIAVSYSQLWREFLPLSLSDMTMAAGDPLMTTTLAHLPDARTNLVAVGIAKSLAIFWESPIIMILHASNSLAPSAGARRALWRFMLVAAGTVTVLLWLSILPTPLATAIDQLFGIPPEQQTLVRHVLMVASGWPLAIAWRRYFQGLLIYSGQVQAVAQASLARLGTLAIVLGLGWKFNAPGGTLAGVALIAGVVVEALMVTLAAYRLPMVLQPPAVEPTNPLPQTVREVWRFYWPLANTMLVVWGGRAVLLSILARAAEPTVAIAAWSSAWGLVLLIANGTRMVQQITIKYRMVPGASQLSPQRDRLLLGFALQVGLVCSLGLGAIVVTPRGQNIILGFVGGDEALMLAIVPVLTICSFVPLLVAVQNGLQGLAIQSGQTGQVNLATWLGTGVLLTVATLGVGQGWAGATSAALAMVAALLVEVGYLGYGWFRTA